MDKLLDFFNLFNAAAKSLANYLPQSGQDLINLLKKALEFGLNLDLWISNNFGGAIRAFLLTIAKIATISEHFLLDLLKQVIARL